MRRTIVLALSGILFATVAAFGATACKTPDPSVMVATGAVGSSIEWAEQTVPETGPVAYLPNLDRLNVVLDSHGDILTRCNDMGGRLDGHTCKSVDF